MSSSGSSLERKFQNSSSWSEMKSRVRSVRRDLSSFSSRIPSNFKFRSITPDGSHVRLYFLASGPQNYLRDTSLYYVDIVNSDENAISSSENEPHLSTMVLKPLLEGEMCYSTGKLSREEELQLERKRCMSMGISHYEMDPKSGHVVLCASGSLFACKDSIQDLVQQGGSLHSPSVTIPTEIKTGLENARLNPEICPTNPGLLAFVNNGNIWVTNVSTGQEVKLTWAHLESGSIADDSVSAGLPSYVMQEEFNRYSGFWWRPVSKGGRYTILYEEVDESSVDILKFPVIGAEASDEFRFPKSGSPNAKSGLNIVQFSLNLENNAISEIETFHLTFPLKRYFPLVEYVVRMGWTPDGDSVWVEMLDRHQSMSEVAIIPITSFRSVSNPFDSEDFERRRQLHMHLHPDTHVSAVYEEMPNPRPPPVQVINRNRSEAWINVGDVLHFLGASNWNSSNDETINPVEMDETSISSTVKGPGDHKSRKNDQVQFITTSEESGWKHLYFVTARINQFHPNLDQSSSTFNDIYLRPHIVSKMALTQGQWCVSDKEIWVDEKNGLVYFHGYRETPLEKHLYVVSIHQPCNVVRLTALGYSHHAELNKDCTLMVSVFSSIHTPHSCQVTKILNAGSGSAEAISLSPLGWLHESRSPDDRTYQFPELFSHTISSGDKLYGMTFKPYNYQEGQKYPVILSVYGGPEVQLVSNSFKGMRHMRNHLLAREGYYVVSVDSRGSSNRGVAFESHIKHKLGQVELADQVEVLNWLGSFNESMDMERIAIHGWSYGGYLSLLGLANYPNLFKVCISGAPVTCWKRYDTGYTERYMGLPSSNIVAYDQGSVINRAHEFPDEPDRLLIVHGMLDENVHFYHHTAPLLHELIKHGKPYQLQVYPTERHSLRRLDASEQYETTLLHFLKSNL